MGEEEGSLWSLRSFISLEEERKWRAREKMGQWRGDSYLDENPLISIHRHF
jgi:hypothetical protein